MMKNIAILIPNLNKGGAERVASNLSFGLSSRFNCNIILHDASSITYPYQGSMIDLKTRTAQTLFGKLITILKRVFLARSIKRKLGIYATISFLDNANIVNILSRRKDKIFISIRNYKSSEVSSFYGKLYKTGIKIFYNKADIIVAVSEIVKKDLIKNFNLKEDKVKVIYNPYDINGIQLSMEEELEPEYQFLLKSPTIINVGRLTDQKGQWHLIRAFKKVKEMIPEAKLIFLGKGELEPYLKKLTKDLSLEKDVIFGGLQKNPFKFMRHSSVFVLSSLYEGFPNCLAEAMACGIPVISSDCRSGPREILAPSTNNESEAYNIEHVEFGVLVPVCDGSKYGSGDKLTNHEEMLADAIVEMLNNKELYKHYSIKSKQRIQDFSNDKIVSQWVDLLDK